MTLVSRRTLLLTGGSGLILAGCGQAAAKGAYLAPKAGEAFAASPFRQLSDKDWKGRLTDAAYQVLRHEGTERPFTSPLDKEKRQGVFVCAGCKLPLFDAKTKFDSGTGWPSFYQSLPGTVATTTDRTLGMTRVEYHCARCLGHQGHIFEDGPPPTGLRYCNNGVALDFIPAKA